MKKHIFITLSIAILFFSAHAQIRVGQDIDGEAIGDQSGTSVAMSADGTIVAVGAQLNGGNGKEAGNVRIFKFTKGEWKQLGADIDGDAAYDQSGFAVSLSNDGLTVAIGAYLNDAGGNAAGQVKVFHYNGTVWSQVGSSINGDAGDQLGSSLCLSGDGTSLAIGAMFGDGKGKDSGLLRVYTNNNGNWVPKGSYIEWNGTGGTRNFTVSISNDGNTVALGGNGTDAWEVNYGHVKAYRFVKGDWQQIGGDIIGEAAGDCSGHSLSFSENGDILAIGARLNDGGGRDAGHVRVYEFSSGNWTQVGTDIDGEAIDDGSGIDVALSGDGSILAIGASMNDGNGNSSGQTRIYRFKYGIWSKIGSDIDGEAANDGSGRSVAISKDGRYVVIGAPNNWGNGNSAGHARVYDLEDVLSAEQIEIYSSISLFPNPANDVLNLRVPVQLVNNKFDICDLSGKTIFSQKIMAENVMIDLSNYTSGMYFFKIEGCSNSEIKFIKK